MKILFHVMQFGYRGTEISTYNLAKYAQQYLDVEPIIIGTKQREQDSYDLFSKSFKTIHLKEDWNAQDNSKFRGEIEQIIGKEKPELYYVQKGGESDNFIPLNCKTFVHCVFNMREPHGDIYAGISEYLAKKYNQSLFLPYIIESKQQEYLFNFRQQLGIPKDALVLGRHGGVETFDILFVQNAISKALEKRKDLYFIFLGTNPFTSHERVFFLRKDVNPTFKDMFISSCDAMIHARNIGETFGAAIGEFSVFNKPIITHDGSQCCYHDKSHIEILGNKGIYYSNEENLINILLNLDKKDIIHKDWNAYKQFAPDLIINKFKNLIK